MKIGPPLTAFLAMRPGEMFHLSERPYDQAGCYAVMLHETPLFPGSEHHPESKNFTVLCAGWYNTEEGELGEERAWGWVHLEASTKEIIGNGLENIHAVPGKWYYMLTSGALGNRPPEHFKVGVND
jgi:hypothetical protein